MLTLTNKQARQFILLKHGLLGAHKFIGKQGALEFVRQAGCIQFDPVDSCGKNAELTLQSRVKNFTKQTLSELLYTDRSLALFPALPSGCKGWRQEFSGTGRTGKAGDRIYPYKRSRKL